MVYESLYDVGKWGKLLAKDCWVYPVAELVRTLIHAADDGDGMPIGPAIREVALRVGGDTTVRGFLTHPTEYAREIPPQWDWDSNKRVEFEPGKALGFQALLVRLVEHWKKHAKYEEDLYVGVWDGQVAIDYPSAARLFASELRTLHAARDDAHAEDMAPANREGHAIGEVVELRAASTASEVEAKIQAPAWWVNRQNRFKWDANSQLRELLDQFNMLRVAGYTSDAAYSCIEKRWGKGLQAHTVKAQIVAARKKYPAEQQGSQSHRIRG